MKPLDQLDYNPTAEKLVQVICSKVQNLSPLFCRVQVAYYFCVVASMMRCSINTLDRGKIPINMYALNLSTSGTGKGHSTAILEERIFKAFKDRFLTETLPLSAEVALPKLGMTRAKRYNTDPDTEIQSVENEFKRAGPVVFSFDSGTTPAVKQLRHKLLMAGIGSINLQMDEIANNLLSNTEVLSAFLELYDIGLIKPKLVKSTNDNARNEELYGRTPTNMMLFGTPTQLLSGGKAEDELFSMLETGYARRCFFGFSPPVTATERKSAEDIFNEMTSASTDTFVDDFSEHLENLADVINANVNLTVDKATTLLLINYRQHCEVEAAKLSEFESTKKAEIAHRYFKAMKLAGAYAFIEGSSTMTEDHVYQAIKLAEESGEAFGRMLTRERLYVKLAKYLAETGCEATQADLVQDLPFYRGSASQKQDMMTLAIAYGYKNNIIIKRSVTDNIEFFTGESLKPTDLDSMIVSYGQHMAEGYLSERVGFDAIHNLTQQNGYHWVNHHLRNSYRDDDHTIPGFNMVVIDIDGSANIDTAEMLLGKYKYHLYTTKSHTSDSHHFRMVFPINYELYLDGNDFKEFMKNIFDWLPFPVDTQTGQRSRKWESFNHHYKNNDGELLDCLPFIPKTSKNDERQNLFQTQQSLDNLERWMVNHIGDGNRNNLLHRFAMVLVDAGNSLEEVRSKVLSLNSKISDPLSEVEITTSIMTTVINKISAKLSGK